MNDRQQNREAISRQIHNFLSINKHSDAISAFLDLHPGDQVEVFEFLDQDDKKVLLDYLDDRSTAILFSHQEDEETFNASTSLTIERLANIVDKMEPDEAADLLGDLPAKKTEEVLNKMSSAKNLLQLLKYPDETAGGRMTTEFVSILENSDMNSVLELMREKTPNTKLPYYIFVIDENLKLLGVLGLREIVISPPNTQVKQIMDHEVISVNTWMDQEEVSRVMITYDLSALPVVNLDHQLVGVITHDDILDVLQDEATEDIYKLSNVSNFELHPDSPVKDQVRGRIPWLLLNTFTALFASWIISNFEVLIAQVAVLAVFQSVVASQGGNLASQSVAMFVRAIALGKISSGHTLSLLGKQILVGLLQGILIGSLVGFGVYFWRGNLYLGLILGFALVANMILAGVIGTLIPIGLKSIGQDPALASSVLVTAITDSLGFLIFLSLANHYLGYLL